MALQPITLSYDGQFGHPQTIPAVGMESDGSNLKLATGATVTTPAGTFFTLSAGPTLTLNAAITVSGDITLGAQALIFQTGQEIEGDAGGLILRVPTGDTFELEINSVVVVEISTAGGAGVIAGAPGTAAVGSNLLVRGGTGADTFAGGDLQLRGGTGTGAGAAGGSVLIGAGTVGSGNADGGTVTIAATAASGSGTNGTIQLKTSGVVQATLDPYGNLVFGTGAGTAATAGGGVGYWYTADGTIPVPGTTEFAAGLVTAVGTTDNGDVKPAQADSLANARVLGVVREGSATDLPVRVCSGPGVVVPVQFTAAHAAITRGSIAYLSQTVAGGIQITAPGSGTVSKIVGYFVTALAQDVVGDAYFAFAPEPATTVP